MENPRAAERRSSRKPLRDKGNGTAVLYARSAVYSATSIERQLAACTAHAERLGLQVTSTYVDNGASAYKGRPQFTQLRDDVTAGTVGAVIAYDVSRLSRNPLGLLDFADRVASAGAALHTVDLGDITPIRPRSARQA